MSRSQDRRKGARYLRKLARAVGAEQTGALEAATQDALADVHAEEALELAVRTIERETGTTLEPQLRAALETLFLEDGKRAIQRLKQQGVDARSRREKRTRSRRSWILTARGRPSRFPKGMRSTRTMRHSAGGAMR
jgi:hypothetical protein